MIQPTLPWRRLSVDAIDLFMAASPLDESQAFAQKRGIPVVDP